ncbi:unnamed protein product [Lactuca virosa]|uniref:Cytochrome c oxidase subunit 5C n=1 Tax=Lactuca virosa TaxID=75947 RepID=A0AAU9P0B9_9ASTR|nr:unnamed protein product [Lactuca virosa]
MRNTYHLALRIWTIKNRDRRIEDKCSVSVFKIALTSSSKGSLIYLCIPPASCSNRYCWLYQKKTKMAGAPPGTTKMIIKEIGIGMVLGYICGAAWKYTYHKDLTRRTKSFYHMLDKESSEESRTL